MINVLFCMLRSCLDDLHLPEIYKYNDIKNEINDSFINHRYPNKHLHKFLGIGKYDTLLNENYKELSNLYLNNQTNKTNQTNQSNQTHFKIDDKFMDFKSNKHPIIQMTNYHNITLSTRLNNILDIQIECFFFF